MHEIEIRIVRDDASVDVIVGEQRSSVAFLDLAAFLDTDASGDVAGFGNTLARRVFNRAQLDVLGALEPGSRILLTVADHRLATIPWETLRIGNGELLAERCAFTRWTAAERPAAKMVAGTMLNLVAIPVAPIDGYQPVLATEREYRGLQSTIVTSGSAVRLVRVRPPTLEATALALRPGMPNGVFFMGHSDSSDGRSVLAFEDNSGRTRLIEAREFASVLAADVAFVVLNSCWSAKAGSTTELGNIARGLAQRGIRHALGMQSELADDAAILLSRELLRALLTGSGFEEAVRHVRAFFKKSTIADGEWIATVPVCYTSGRTASLPIAISRGTAEIEPSPARIAARTDLTALPAPEELIGRGAETSAILDALSGGRTVVLHGLGGIGKTCLARAAAERVAWRYDDRVLAVRFDTIDEGRFRARLARFYEVDDVATSVIEASRRTKALLVLDNVETLFESIERGVPTAVSLGALIHCIGGGSTDLLLTSRLLPQDSWNASVVDVRGLSTADGAELFVSLLPADRREAARVDTARRLAARVEGHPLGIRLLAMQFALTSDDLEHFLGRMEEELTRARASQDDGRLATLDACIHSSVERLDAAARAALDTLTLFQAPFLEILASELLDMPEETFSATLDDLVRHGLLSRRRETWDQETITLYEIHQTLRWYLAQRRTSPPSAEEVQRFARVLLSFADAAESTDAVTRSRWMRRVLFTSLPDFLTALNILDPLPRARLAYLLVRPLEYFGQIAEARRLAEYALKVAEEHDQVLLMTAALLRIGDLMNKMSEPADAVLAMHDRAVALGARLGPESGAASQIHTQIGYLHFISGQPEEALASYRLAREALDRAADVPEELRRSKEAQCDYMIARALSGVGRNDEAMELFDSAIPVLLRESPRAASVALDAMAGALVRQKRYDEALQARERAIAIMQEMDVRAAAVIRGNLATTLIYLGRLDEARASFQDALTVLRESGDALEAASVEERFAVLLHGTGQLADAIRLLWSAHRTYETLRRERDAQKIVAMFRDMKAKTGVRVFGNWWHSTIGEPEPPWLADVENDAEAPLGRARLAQKALTTALDNTIAALQPGNDEWKASWRQMLVEVGAGFERDGETVLWEFNTALLALVDGHTAQLSRDHPYYIPFNHLLDAARAVTGREMGADPELSQMTEVISDLVHASTPERLAHIIRERHELIVRRQEIAGYLRMLSEQEFSKGNRDYARELQTCASLLDGLSAEQAGDVAERVEQATSREDTSPQGRAQRAALAALGDVFAQQAMVAELDRFIAASASDDERLFYGALRLGVVEGRADIMVRFRNEELIEAWEGFGRTIASGGVDAAVFEQLSASVYSALAPAADAAAVSACRRILARMRNEAIAAGLAQFADLVHTLTDVVDACAAGANILTLDLSGTDLRGTYYRIWREIVAQVRQRHRPPIRPELHRAVAAYLGREDQTGTIELFRAHAGELVSDEAIDELWLLSIQQRGVKSFENRLKTHLRLLEWARQQGLAAAVTRDVAMSFAAESNPALLMPVFEVSADVLSLETANDVFRELDRYQQGNPAGRVGLLRKAQMFRRIIERGAAAALADEARLADKREAARALVVGVVQQVLRPDRQEAHVTEHEALLHDSELPPLIGEVAEQLAAGSAEHPEAAEIVHAIGVYMELLERCRTDGIAATFERHRRLLSWLLEILNAPRAAEREVARRIDAECPGALTSDEAFVLAFQLQEQMREEQNWPAFKTARRVHLILRRWKESHLDTAFDEGDAVEADQGKLAEVLTALSGTDDQAEIRAIIERHADMLLHPATDIYFDEMLAEMRRSAPPKMQAYFFRLREFLRRCRDLGISAAFGEE